METKELTNALLKEKMTDAMVDRGYFSNIDECRAMGVYKGGGPDATGTYPTSESSWKYGTLEVLGGRTNRVTQRLVSDFGDCAVRTSKVNSTEWNAWKIMT